MNRLQLATLLSWAGETGIQGRKRLQKVVFFLQDAGCPLGCQYTLHHFGPYSRDVADACDEMVAAGLIEEKVEPQAGITQYRYLLKQQTQELLRQVPQGQMQAFEAIARELISENIWSLELGSTILLFYRQSGDWNDALTEACQFKKTEPEDEKSQISLRLAQRVASQAGHL